jgi:hypothetical protein
VEAARPTEIPGALRTAASLVPSELYANAVSRATGQRPGSAAVPLAGLIAWAVAIHGLGFVVFVRILETPAS